MIEATTERVDVKLRTWVRTLSRTAGVYLVRARAPRMTVWIAGFMSRWAHFELRLGA